MQLTRWMLIFGGAFNCIMGSCFFVDPLLRKFFQLAMRMETIFFSQPSSLVFPNDPVHLLLIHGFGAAALILGATLIYSSRDPFRFRAFILFDGAGRLLFGTMMMVYVLRYALMRTIAVFGLIEVALGLIYLGYVVLSTGYKAGSSG